MMLFTCLKINRKNYSFGFHFGARGLLVIDEYNTIMAELFPFMGIKESNMITSCMDLFLF